MDSGKRELCGTPENMSNKMPEGFVPIANYLNKQQWNGFLYGVEKKFSSVFKGTVP